MKVAAISDYNLPEARPRHESVSEIMRWLYLDVLPILDRALSFSIFIGYVFELYFVVH